MHGYIILVAMHLQKKHERRMMLIIMNDKLLIKKLHSLQVAMHLQKKHERRMILIIKLLIKNPLSLQESTGRVSSFN